MDDAELLRAYADERSDSAFAALVQRRLAMPAKPYPSLLLPRRTDRQQVESVT